MITRRTLLAQLAIAGAGSLLAACGLPAPPGSPSSAAGPASAPTAAGAAASSAARNYAILGAPAEPGGLNPLLLDNGSSGPAWEQVFEGLVVPHPQTGAPSPSLALSWDSSPDGLTWTFHMRPNVVWSDGQPFTAADAAFTFDAILDPKVASPRRSTLSNIAAYDAPDAATFRVSLKQPDCPFLTTTMLTPIVPKHALAGVADFNTDDFNSTRPVGTGPFMFKEWTVR